MEFLEKEERTVSDILYKIKQTITKNYGGRIVNCNGEIIPYNKFLSALDFDGDYISERETIRWNLAMIHFTLNIDIPLMNLHVFCLTFDDKKEQYRQKLELNI